MGKFRRAIKQLAEFTPEQLNQLRDEIDEILKQKASRAILPTTSPQTRSAFFYGAEVAAHFIYDVELPRFLDRWQNYNNAATDLLRVLDIIHEEVRLFVGGQLNRPALVTGLKNYRVELSGAITILEQTSIDLYRDIHSENTYFQKMLGVVSDVQDEIKSILMGDRDPKILLGMERNTQKAELYLEQLQKLNLRQRNRDRNTIILGRAVSEKLHAKQISQLAAAREVIEELNLSYTPETLVQYYHRAKSEGFIDS